MLKVFWMRQFLSKYPQICTDSVAVFSIPGWRGACRGEHVWALSCVGTRALASHWSRHITWPEHWPLIGWYRSRDPVAAPRRSGWELHHYEVKVYCREDPAIIRPGLTSLQLCVLTQDLLDGCIIFTQAFLEYFEPRFRYDIISSQTQFVPPGVSAWAVLIVIYQRGGVMDGYLEASRPCCYPEIIISKRHSNGTERNMEHFLI